MCILVTAAFLCFVVLGSVDFESTPMLNGRSVLDIAKEDIDKLEAKKDGLKKRRKE